MECRGCQKELHLQVCRQQCSTTLRAKVRGWMRSKSNKGNWYCPKCAKGWAESEDTTNLKDHLCLSCVQEAAWEPDGLTTYSGPAGSAGAAGAAAATPTGSSTTEIESVRAQLCESQAVIDTLRARIEVLEDKMESLQQQPREGERQWGSWWSRDRPASCAATGRRRGVPWTRDGSSHAQHGATTKH